MKSKKYSYLLVGLLALPLAFGALDAQARRDRGGHGHGDYMFKKLDLTKEQKEKLADLRKNQKGDIKETVKKMRSLREKAKTAFEGTASDSELKAIHQEMKTLRSEIEDQRFQRILAIRSILTPEQRKKFHDGHQRGMMGHSMDDEGEGDLE